MLAVPLGNLPRMKSKQVIDEDGTALEPGTRLHEFELIRVLGEGGFGVVYLARDTAQQRLVAIKEYMPASLARRGDGTRIHLRSDREEGLFEAGLESFIAEARMLARFDHPALVKMIRSWEENGTAYTVMPYYEGVTLKALRDGSAGAPTEPLLRRILETLLGALGTLHAASVFHRDISPDNILMQPDGWPVLLDFGAARQVIADRTQSITSILKPSFAPIEQYAHAGELRQGAWTDLYSLGAVMYFMIVGHAPPPAAARALDDDLARLSELAVDGAMPVSASLCAVIDWCLEFRPERRPQSTAEVIEVLEGRRTVPPPAPRERAATRGDRTGAAPWTTTVDIERQRRGGANGPHHAPATRRIALAALAIPLCVGAGAWGVYTQTADTRPHIVATAAAATRCRCAQRAAPPRRRLPARRSRPDRQRRRSAPRPRAATAIRCPWRTACAPRAPSRPSPATRAA